MTPSALRAVRAKFEQVRVVDPVLDVLNAIVDAQVEGSDEITVADLLRGSVVDTCGKCGLICAATELDDDLCVVCAKASRR